MGLHISKTEESHSADSFKAETTIPGPKQDDLLHPAHDPSTPEPHSSKRSILRRNRASISLQDYEQEEEKWEDSPPMSDEKKDHTTFLSSVFVESRRRLLGSSSQVHPDVVGLEHEGRYPRRILESLPSPQVNRSNTAQNYSVPVRCPPPRQRTESGTILSGSDADVEYLAKMYDNRTWNMYKLITESREKSNSTYQPHSFKKNEETKEHDPVHEFHSESDMSPPSCTHAMVFHLDDFE